MCNSFWYHVNVLVTATYVFKVNYLLSCHVMLGCKPLETDTHWRCKKGKASWNYRLLFDVELGHSTRIMKARDELHIVIEYS